MAYQFQLTEPNKNTRLTVPSVAAAHDTAPSGLIYVLAVFRRRAVSVVLLAIAGLVAALAVAFTEQKQYQTRATVEVQPLNENYLDLKSVDPTSGADSTPGSYLATQVKLLQSRTLLKRVVRRLGLSERSDFQPHPGRMDALLKDAGLAEQAQPSALDNALDTLRANLNVQPSADTRLIEVTFTWGDPAMAARITNTLVKEYVDQNMEARWNSAQSTSDWLTPRLAEIRKGLEHSEEELQAFAKGSGVVFTAGEQDSAAEMQFLDLQKELSKAQADRVIRQTDYEITRDASMDMLPKSIDAGSIRDYSSKLADLRQQLAALEVSFTPAFPKVQHLQAQIHDLEASRAKEWDDLRNRIRKDYEGAKRREDLLKQSYLAQAQLMSDQAGKVVRYRILQNEVKTNQELYAAMLRETKQAGIALTLNANNLRVVDEADPPARPFKPNLGWHAVVGLLLGACSGLTLAFVKESRNQTIRSPGEATHWLGLPELGVVLSSAVDRRLGAPQRVWTLTQPKPRGSEYLSLAAAMNGGAKDPSGDQSAPDSPDVITRKLAPSLMAESLRSTAASIRFSDSYGRRSQLLVVTSAGASEGKTTITTNLGLVLAELGRRVLLIDGDVRRPRLHTIFGTGMDRGLTVLLADRTPVRDYSSADLGRPTQIPGLFVLPLGVDSSDIPRLLSSERMRELALRLRKEYDSILIDTAPSLQFSYSREFAQLADGAIIVVRAGKTDVQSAAAVKHRLEEDKIPILGTILNDFDPKANSAYGYNYAAYYRDSDSKSKFS